MVTRRNTIPSPRCKPKILNARNRVPSKCRKSIVGVTSHPMTIPRSIPLKVTHARERICHKAVSNSINVVISESWWREHQPAAVGRQWLVSWDHLRQVGEHNCIVTSTRPSDMANPIRRYVIRHHVDTAAYNTVEAIFHDTCIRIRYNTIWSDTARQCVRQKINK